MVRSFRSLWFSAALLLVLSSPCFGWGDLGHSVVGEIAERLVRPATRVRLRRILAPTGMSLAEAATWPDHMRSDADFKNTAIASWHFVELDPATHMPSNPVNAIWAIELSEAILSGSRQPYEVPRTRPNVGNRVVIDQAKAVAFLAHLVGDIHQPLHVGNGRDHGANDCLVKWFGKTRNDEGFWNLHAVWDDGILDKLSIGRLDLTHDLLRRFDRVSRASFLNARSAGEWAQESAGLRPRVYPQVNPQQPVGELEHAYCRNRDYAYDRMPRPDGHVIAAADFARVETQILGDARIPRLSYDYKFEHVELVKTQLLKAGVRLAFALDRALAR